MPACVTPATRLRLADVFARSVDDVLRCRPFSFPQARVLRRVASCRTPALGGHRVVCSACGHAESRYHSCRDRHCPTCQALPQARWIAQRERRVLPIGHFQVVFTLPGQLRPFAVRYPRVIYDLLVRAASKVLLTLGREVLGGRLGLTVVLHTWTRELLLHPHVHCIVTSGALSEDAESWTEARKGYLFSIRRMAAMFRARLLTPLTAMLDDGALQCPPGTRRTALLRRLWRARWVVYAGRPFGKVAHLVRYLGRYTHRVALSDHRVVRIDSDGLVFKAREGKVCRLGDEEFLARFARHVLPSGLRKIRHYGLYAPSSIARLLPAARALVSEPEQSPEAEVEVEVEADSTSVDPMETLRLLTGFDPRLCPACGEAVMEPCPDYRARDGPGTAG